MQLTTHVHWVAGQTRGTAMPLRMLAVSSLAVMLMGCTTSEPEMRTGIGYENPVEFCRNAGYIEHSRKFKNCLDLATRAVRERELAERQAKDGQNHEAAGQPNRLDVHE